MKKLFLAAMGIFLTGCSTGADVNETAYVRAAAVDSGKVTFSFYLDEKVISVEADSLESAESAAELAVGKEIFTGHTELVILSDCDKKGVIEYMLRQWKVSPSCRIAEAENGMEVLKKRKAEEIADVLAKAEEKGVTEKCGIVTVLGQFLKDGTAELPFLNGEGDLQN